MEPKGSNVINTPGIDGPGDVEASTKLEPGRKRSRILVVEDEIFIRILIAEELREKGFDVVEAISGDEALKILQSGTLVDLVFTDVRMPGKLDGVALAAIIRSNFKNMKVIVTSAHLPPEATPVSDAFFPKPYGPTQVAAVIERLLANDT